MGIILQRITTAIIELEIDTIQELVTTALDSGIDPADVLTAATDGMDEVGRLYEGKEYYLTELILAGETMKETLEILAPALQDKGDASSGKDHVILATVKGDQHDIGKNILHSLLIPQGCIIHDLGMNVDAGTIVTKVRETGAKVIGLSSLLTMTIDQVRVVHEALVAAGLRDCVKIIVGGAPLNMELALELGADAYAKDATSGVQEIKRLLAS
ncbi:cobalamin-binding protein [Candidatus Bathyarchaeota archaeon]|nr:cobalamin-binding protein [Candidatus Bathyarchaeota archaeon]